MFKNNNNLDESLNLIKESMGSFSKEIGNILIQAFEPFSVARKVYQEQMSELLEGVRRGLESLPAETRYAQTELLKRGWYIAGDMAIPDIKNIRNMSDEQIEFMMIDYARGELLSLRNQIERYFPLRYDILKDAISAHDERLYNLSIPVFLTQADGIANDLLNVSLFKKDKGDPKTKKVWREKIETHLGEDSVTYEFLLRPLDVLSSIQVNTWDRDSIIKENSSYSTLNRHGVLHGLDVDYGTEANSLRCVMLISYLIDLNEHFFIK